MKSAVVVSMLALTAFAVLEESAAAHNYLNCVRKKVVIVDAPKGITSSTTEENFGLRRQKLSRSQMGRSSMSAAWMTAGSAL
jgi:hypothetical protein